MEFTLEQTQKFKRYEQIKRTIKELEEEADDIKPELLPLVPEGKEVAGEFGVFTIMKTSKIKYSSQLQAEADTLKEKQKDEVRMGIAEVTENITLRYTEKKQSKQEDD